MLTALLMIALAPINTPSFFGDYVLNVPVRIESMRNLSSARLRCNILHIGTSPTDRASLGTPGTGQADVPLSAGAFNGTIAVTVSVSAANALRYTPTTWSCSLIFLWRNPDGTEFSESLSGADERGALYTRITGQEISQNTTEISGPLPPP